MNYHAWVDGVSALESAAAEAFALFPFLFMIERLFAALLAEMPLIISRNLLKFLSFPRTLALKLARPPLVLPVASLVAE